MSKKLFLSADNLIFENAKNLRNTPTYTETLLWGFLCNNQLGCKFRRQHPLGKYIADFYAHQYKLVIEVDGSIHRLPDVLRNDIEKESYFLSEGIKTIRFTNDQVIHQMDVVIEKIKEEIDLLSNPASQKLPLQGAGGVGIIRYGAGNIFSLTAALERLNIPYGMIDAPDDFEQYDRYIIPGVGHAGAAMQKLQDTGLVPKIKDLKKPTLGVCVGMQLMTAYSEEGDADLLDIVPVKTQRFTETPGFKVPHTGWNRVNVEKTNPLFDNIPNGSHFYFVHSYFVGFNNAYTLASTDYINKFSASIWHDNFFGVQFHPEKSGEYGETLLKNFTKI